jgi:hypothetical protein
MIVSCELPQCALMRTLKHVLPKVVCRPTPEIQGKEFDALNLPFVVGRNADLAGVKICEFDRSLRPELAVDRTFLIADSLYNYKMQQEVRSYSAL